MFPANCVYAFYIQIQPCCFVRQMLTSHVEKHTNLLPLTLWSWSGFVHAPILTPKTEAPNATRTHHPTSFFSKRHRERVSEGLEERGEFKGVENDRTERGIQKAAKTRAKVSEGEELCVPDATSVKS